MIVFDLKCGAGHVFESWFGSSAAYEEQRAGRMIACPMCGDSEVTKAVMAPNVAAKGNRRSGATVPAEPGVPTSTMPEPPPEVVKAAMAELARLQAKALEGSQWVGGSFAKRARAMHEGDEEHALIHGQATPDEARELIEDGVAVSPLPFPVVPPEARN
ncbi:DUF1178 family protein [Sphingomonas sp. LB-2]|uniref:DUF1178 family protein n=1 Tax=Sphingomonas caeni TaxID=2984949 RepID=UPI00222FBC46|nr:DUF1178 family protein [Sphingomonas caeni]MCW3849538.1 DUF1178 family protein [Sphingomonas caeni]